MCGQSFASHSSFHRNKLIHAGEMPYEWRRYGQSFIPVCFKHMKELKMQNAVRVGSVLEPSGDAGPFVNRKDLLEGKKPHDV